MVGVTRERSAALRREILELVGEHLSVREVARRLECDRGTVRTVMDEAGLAPLGALQQRAQNQLNRDVLLTDDLLQLLNGLLLGDGGIASRPNRIPRFELTGKSEEYLRFVSAEFQRHGVRNKVARHANGYWRLWSQAWPSLRTIVADWYGVGTRKRAVPVGLVLSPTAVLHWYLGDGGLAKHKGKRPTAYLYTNSFAEQDVRRLAETLTSQGMPALALRCGGPQAHEWRIHLNRPGIMGLLEYVGPCPVTEYAYKWAADTVHR